MVVIWQEQARNDLKNYSKYSKSTINNIKEYIHKLVDYIDVLEESPLLGKEFCIIKGRKLRQLVYEKHRIFYYVHNNLIYIVAVVHTSRNIDNVIKYIGNMFK